LRLILHIGTHKTGTSAVQECLRRSQSRLAKHRIYYAHRPGAKNANILARWAGKGRKAEAEDFLRNQLFAASNSGAETVVISAESFYAMTTFFHKFNGRHDPYWEAEANAIRLLRAVLPRELPTRVVVFVRRQDHFLESIYPELVKSKGVAQPLCLLRAFMSEALDYCRHIDLWQECFATDCCVYTYEEASNDAPEFFLRRVLGIDCTEGFIGLRQRLNLRMNRDLVEYKRLLNAQPMSKVERRLSQQVCVELAKVLSDDGHYREYLSPDKRQSLLREVEPSNLLLVEKYGITPFPPLRAEQLEKWVPYPGLSLQRTATIRAHYNSLDRGPRHQLERVRLHVSRFLRKRAPFLRATVPIARAFFNR
jgi:hypothetical protein